MAKEEPDKSKIVLPASPGLTPEPRAPRATRPSSGVFDLLHKKQKEEQRQRNVAYSAVFRFSGVARDIVPGSTATSPEMARAIVEEFATFWFNLAKRDVAVRQTQETFVDRTATNPMYLRITDKQRGMWAEFLTPTRTAIISNWAAQPTDGPSSKRRLADEETGIVMEVLSIEDFHQVSRPRAVPILKDSQNSLTKPLELREDQTGTAGVLEREKPDKGKIDSNSSPLVAARRLIKRLEPTETPKEIFELKGIVEDARAHPPQTEGAKVEFVEAVNRLIEFTGFCFKLKPGNEIARRLGIHPGSGGSGIIQFRTTQGASRSFVKYSFDLVPYRRPYHRSE